MQNFSSIIPYLVLASHPILLAIVVLFLGRRTFGHEAIRFIRRRAVSLSLSVAALATLGSLFYSNVLGYEPCVLCWWQRVFLFPQVVIFLAALKREKLSAFVYSLPLSVLGLIVSLYQAIANEFGTSLLPCTATGGACSKVYVEAFGYITIPVMALTVFAYLLVFALIARSHEDSRP